jgi:molybdate transport system regulatory protein
MGLRIGMEVHAFVNATSIVLMVDGGGRVTARNRFWGEIAEIHEGPVDCEVTLSLAGGRSITAVMTQDSMRRLELAVGQTACAMFKAPSVIIARFD